jgi:hypothetical protein
MIPVATDFSSSLTFSTWSISDDIGDFRQLSGVSSFSALFSSDDIGCLQCKLLQNVEGADRTCAPGICNLMPYQ